ncbi:MAG: hypothetical protein J6U98_06150 [Abditibacteriota bacterium]|nr:hypothetical protein [Abditibacteriota bacterium]
MKTYYVSPAGSDETGTGTKENPFASIGRADELRLLLPGDVVSVAPGRYDNLFLSECYGTAEKPVTYKAEGEVFVSGETDIATGVYIVLEGFTFDIGNVVFDDEPQGCVVRDCFFDVKMGRVCVEFNEGENCRFENNTVKANDLEALCSVSSPGRIDFAGNKVEGGELKEIKYLCAYPDTHFPNTENHFTLQGDFHVHTSDGSDGKNTTEERMAEAKARGLDVIAVTDHGWVVAERKYAKKQREKAQKLADELGLIYMPGFETGLKFPPLNGREHIVVFDTDEDPVDFDHGLTEDGGEHDYMKRIEYLNEKGAFIIWPHPDSDYPGIELADELAREPIKKLIEKGLIKGVELINGDTAEYPSQYWGERYTRQVGPRGGCLWMRVMDYAVKHNLAVFSNTDAHNALIPCYTLILAKERTRKGVREALEAGRTAAYFEDILWARRDVAEELIKAMAPFNRYIADEGRHIVKATFTNTSPMILMPEIDGHVFAVQPYESLRLIAEFDEPLKVKWTNIFIGTDKCLEMDY